jgi:hypothetical protein
MKTILLTLLSNFFSRREAGLPDQLGLMMDSVKQNIRAEVSAVIFKSLIGLVIAVATILSLVQFGRDLQVLFSQIQYGLYFEIVTFGIVSGAGCYLLYALFRQPPKIVVVAEPTGALDLASMIPGVDVPGIFSRFTEGLVKGYRSNIENSEINRNLQTDF